MDEIFYHVQSRALGGIDVFCALQRLEDDWEISMAGVEIKSFEQLRRDVEAFEPLLSGLKPGPTCSNSGRVYSLPVFLTDWAE